MLTRIRPQEVIRMTDASLLRPDAARSEMVKLCEEARRYHFAAVFAMTCWTPLLARELEGSDVRVGASVAFPLGSASTFSKVAETRDAIASGAHEVDTVMNIGALKGGDYALAEKDIRAVVEAAEGRIVKVIMETCLLTDEQKRDACLIIKEAGADFVKTSSGFSRGGATVEDIALMRRVVGPDMGVKASGGIGTYEDAVKVIQAGANRIGTSNGVGIAQAALAAEAAFTR